MESTRHKGVILGNVRKHHQLCTAYRLLISGEICSFLDNAAHFSNSVHIYTRLGRRHVYRGADKVCFGKSVGDRLDKTRRICGKALLNQRAVAADKVYAESMRGSVKSFRYANVILGRIFAAHERYRRYRHTLVDYRDTKLLFDITANADEVLGSLGYLVVNSVAHDIYVIRRAVVKRDTHSYRSDIKVLLFYHIYSFKNIVYTNIDHLRLPSDPMH